MIIFKFSLLDWLIIAVLVYSIVISWYKGFVREILGLITVLAGVSLAAWFYRGVGDMFKGVVRTENIALFLGFFLIFRHTFRVDPLEALGDVPDLPVDAGEHALVVAQFDQVPSNGCHLTLVLDR